MVCTFVPWEFVTTWLLQCTTQESVTGGALIYIVEVHYKPSAVNVTFPCDAFAILYYASHMWNDIQLHKSSESSTCVWMHVRMYLCVHGWGYMTLNHGHEVCEVKLLRYASMCLLILPIDSSHFSLSHSHPSESRQFSCWHSVELQCAWRTCRGGQDTSHCGNQFLLQNSSGLYLTECIKVLWLCVCVFMKHTAGCFHTGRWC